MRVIRQLGQAALCALLVLGLGACADKSFNGPNGGVDNDNDGYTADVDCDDDNPNINPGAKELENCIDDNCDGEVDEGTPNHDVDHDGYCVSTGDVGDCEGNPTRNPGMPEDGGDGSGKANGIDDNCNGLVDDGLATSDVDGDGFAVTDGDCNDRDASINPGAIEVTGRECRKADDCPNGKCYGGYCRCVADDDCASLEACIDDTQCTKPGEKCISQKCRGTWACLAAVEGMENPELKVCRDNADNDCDGKRDELPTLCDDPTKLDKTKPLDYARAIELCDTDITCAPPEKPCPGQLACVDGHCRRVLSAEFNKTGNAKARAIVTNFAKSTTLLPRMGQSMIVLSTGLAEYDPQQNCPQDGEDFLITGDIDPDPKSSDPDTYDMASLKLQILVPTNARSFSFDFQFFSAEYPDYLDSEFNDTFWVALDSKNYTGNISFDKNGVPIKLNNAFFDICDPDPFHPQTSQFCTKPAAMLTGTGYAKDCAGGGPFGPACGGASCGGSTGWLTTTSPVEPGEIITLTFYIFDKGDGILDSAVLIDNFRWSLTPALKPITGPD